MYIYIYIYVYIYMYIYIYVYTYMSIPAATRVHNKLLFDLISIFVFQMLNRAPKLIQPSSCSRAK